MTRSRPPIERRRQPRQRVRALVDLIGNEVLLNHPVENLSPDGLGLQTECLEPVGRRLDLVLRLPAQGVIVPLQGEVIWVNHDPPMDMGLRFVEPGPERARALQRCLGPKPA